MTGSAPQGADASRSLIDRFVADGYVRIDEAFPRSIAEECRTILWQATGCSPDDPNTWTLPVVRLFNHAEPSFRTAAASPVLAAAYDTLVGPDAWQPMVGLGTFPIRFPSTEDPGDDGWHIDAGFNWEAEPDFLKWRVNADSRGRALLVPFLFSDVAEHDAPTRIRVGSHTTMAQFLAPFGEQGATLGEIADSGIVETEHHPEVLATGNAGTVYLCHPFLVHAAQKHRGKVPKFMAQPPLIPTDPAGPPADSIVMRGRLD
ncbi:MAG TPA: phytanoyl-CoA dioxygenase family protein [Microthrixaceae bacterium]|nr:phytanoyl-CoA dioxygenase family protein [Microthrixaceae bacterium]